MCSPRVGPASEGIGWDCLRYRKEQDRFNDRERAQLGFVRFLSETGRLAS
jgi:hypothetical protein